MNKKIISLESLRKSTLSGGYFTIVLMDIVGFGVSAFLAQSLGAWAIMVIAAIVLTACTIYMIKKQKNLEENPPDYIVMEDTLTRIATVISGSRKNRTRSHYVWFEDLNDYHDYGWISPSVYYQGMPREKYYLIKETTRNDILFTYAASMYELSDDLKRRLQPVKDVQMNNGNKGRKLDENRYNVSIEELV